MTVTAPTQVDCVSGCGGGVDWLSIAIALVGVALAAAALIVAFLAWKTSQTQLKMQREEHKAFLDQINARSDLYVEIHFLTNDAEEQQVNGLYELRTLAIGIKNNGQKSAERVFLNVLAPAMGDMRWSAANGAAFSEQMSPVPIPETLEFGGQNLPAHYIDETIGPIDLSVGGTMKYVRFKIPVGEVRAMAGTEAEPNRVGWPVRVKISSDDQPEDRKSIVVERTWTFVGRVVWE